MGNQREQPCAWGSSSFLSSLWHLPHPLQKRSPAAGVHGAPKMLVEATQLASATLASSITSSALAVLQKTVPCSTLLLTFARIQNPSVIQSLLQRSSGLLDSSTG